MAYLTFRKVATTTLIALLFMTMGCREIEHQLDFQQLTINDRNERKGGGDDVMLGVIYFTANFGVEGSAAVRVLPIRKLQNNVNAGRSVSAARTSAFDFDWSYFSTTAPASLVDFRKSYTQDADELWTEEMGFSFEGVVVVAVEEDNVGDRIMNNKFNEATRNLTNALTRYIENTDYRDTADDIIARIEHIQEALECFQLKAQHGIACETGDSPGGGGINLDIGHDQIGIATVLFIGSENPLLLNGVRNGVTAKRWRGGQVLFESAECGGTVPSSVHVCEFVNESGRAANNQLHLLFVGEDARWTLAVDNLTQIL